MNIHSIDYIQTQYEDIKERYATRYSADSVALQSLKVDIIALQRLLNNPRTKRNLSSSEITDITQLEANLNEYLENINIIDTNSGNVVDDSSYVSYDFTKYTLNLKDWKTLNEDGLPYPIFLRDFILPQFHPLPNGEIQYPILAAAMLMNNAPLPPLSPSNSKEVGLPKCVLVGASRSGKTEITNRAKMHFNDAHIATIKGSSTGYNVTRTIHEACYHSGQNRKVNFYPSIVCFDNVYWQEFIQRLDIHYVSVLAVERNDAVSKIAQDEFYTFSTMWFTSVQLPVRSQQRMDEFINRSLLFFTAKEDQYLPKLLTSDYNWASVCDEYYRIWSANNTEEKFYPTLNEVMRIRDCDTTIPVDRFFASRLPIAVGLYTGIFSDLYDAIEKFTLYWEFVDSQEGGGDMLYQLVEQYLQENWYQPIHRLTKKGIDREVAQQTYYINLPDLTDYLERRSMGVHRSSSQRTVSAVEEILLNHDLVLRNVDNALKFVPKGIK